jgi:thioredoxin 1
MDEGGLIMIKNMFTLVILGIVFGSMVIPQSKMSLPPEATASVAKPFVTFIELGSVNCIPCKAMQPVIKAVETKYGAQVRIVFYDVWKKEQAHYAQQYGIRLIPTQVFLDANGKEILRHEGFFPEKDIDAFLQSKGLKPQTGKKE